MSDDETCDHLHDNDPPGTRTPPTPPVHDPPSPSPRVHRQRSMAQLRPVSIPEIVMNMAGQDDTRKMAAFDRHYMPDGKPTCAPSLIGILLLFSLYVLYTLFMLYALYTLFTFPGCCIY